MATSDILVKLTQNIRCVFRSGGWLTGTRYVFNMLIGLPEVLRKKSLSPVDARMKNRSYRFKLRGKKYVQLKGTDFCLAREICCMEIYYPSPDFYIQAGWNVLDLGANVGVFTMTAAVQGAQVFSVEAQRPFLENYQKNAEENQVTDRVKVKWGVVHLPVGFPNTADTDLGPNMTLTQVLDSFDIKKVDLLKADIEGSEFAMCAEDKRGLARIRRIAMEVHPSHGDVPTMVGNLEEVGFTVQLRNKKGSITNRIIENVGFLYAWR